MPFADVLFLTLGPSIAKAILKYWLKDYDVASDVASDLVGLLSTKTEDVIARQRGKRQFEEIGEKVAESLRPLFQAATIDDGGREAVAYAVAETVDRAGIGPDILAASDLDSSRLARFLLESRPDAARDLTDAETALYRRILSESAKLVVNIASQLPSFTERTLSEVLRRQNLLLSRADDVLSEVRRIREESQQANPEALAAEFEEQYRWSVIHNLDQLELFGADVSSASRRHRLSVAYVTLSVQRQALRPLEGSPLGVEADGPAYETEVEDASEILSVHEALADAHRMLIRGAPGSGKTTLLKWLAVRMASRDFEGPLSDWNQGVPFFVRLRQCTETGFPAPEDFPRLVARAVAGTMPAGWVHQQLKAGRAIVLVDGVDEVPELQRLNLRAWLGELTETYPSSRFIVSSRPNAIDEGWLDAEEFDDASLQAMVLGDIADFIDHWHEAVGQELHDQEEIEDLPGLAEHLKQEIRRRRSLRELTRNPLLCAMICALHRDRRRQLPSDRIELYDACIHMLLERRDLERQLDLRDYPALNYRQKRAILEDLAYWMLQNNYVSASSGQVDERLARKLRHMVGMRDIHPIGVRRLLVERSGVVREPVPGQIDFTHRTFQEYLAAAAAVEEGDVGFLVASAHQDRWHEVVVLAAGLANKRDREILLEELIKRGDEEASHRHQLHLLAVASLETATEVRPGLQQRLEEVLAQLVPPKNLTEAQLLASAGELAVPFLAQCTEEKAGVAAACVRALSLIGGPAALSALERFAEGDRLTLFYELLKAGESFDVDEYDARILSRIGIEDLSMHRGFDVGFLKDMQNLKSLRGSWASSTRGADLSPLAEVTGLECLDLCGLGQVTDLSPLAGLTRLTELRLSGLEQVTDLSPLAGLIGPERLYLSGLRPVADLSALAGLTELRELTYSDWGQVTDLSLLAGLTGMRSLGLYGLEQVADLSALAELTGLEELRLYDLGQVTDLSLLAGLTGMRTLGLSCLEQVTDLSPLAGLIGLSLLQLSGLRQVTDLSPLAGMTGLRRLALLGLEQVTDLSPLIPLARLRWGTLSGLQVGVTVPDALSHWTISRSHGSRIRATSDFTSTYRTSYWH